MTLYLKFNNIENLINFNRNLFLLSYIGNESCNDQVVFETTTTESGNYLVLQSDYSYKIFNNSVVETLISVLENEFLLDSNKKQAFRDVIDNCVENNSWFNLYDSLDSSIINALKTREQI